MLKLTPLTLIPFLLLFTSSANAETQTNGLYFQRVHISEKNAQEKKNDAKLAENTEKEQPKRFKLPDWIQIGMKPRKKTAD